MFINQNKSQYHHYFMRLALQQAKKILGNTKKNPAVGCVITKNNHLISAGYTNKNGRPHAEINALNFLKTVPKNSQMYITLEPCSHFGITPPCVNSIINKKIKKVFFSIKDPDIRSYNKCKKILEKTGIVVNEGLLENEIKIFYKSYINYKKNDLPFVTGKIAISKDFYTINKKKKWITNEFSRGRVHLMRSSHDCILTSSTTVIKDNPNLTCRIKGIKDTSPVRVILDNRLRLGINSKVVKESLYNPTIIFYSKSNVKKMILFKKFKIKFIKIDTNNSGNLDLVKILIKLKKMGYSRIFLESGIKLTTDFLNKNLVDYLKIFTSSKKLKQNGDNNFERYLKSLLRDKKGHLEKVNLLGDRLMSYKLK